MTMVENPAAEVEDPEGGSLPALAEDGEGLVLPEEVLASLAGQLAERARSGGPVTLTGPGGLLTGVIGQVLQAGLTAELDAHLDGGDGEANRRNGSSVKTLNTEVGPVRIAVPRDRDGSFDPVLVPRQARRSDGLDAVITSLYAKGMSVRDIARHVRQTTGVDLSHDKVSRVTDQALEAMREWQHRPLEPFYPVVYVDALVAKVRDGSAVRNKAVNIAVGIDDGGAKRVLGKKYPAAVAVWERAWDRFIPFLEYGPALRRVLYTTNAIESFNREMRKVLKTRTQFPNDDSVAKTLWLAILDAEEKRAEQRARQAGKPKAQRDAVPRLIEGHVTQGWREAWGEMVARWPGRFAGRAWALRGCRMPLPGNGTRAGSVPLDALDAEEIADLLGCAAAVAAALAGLHAALASAAADLDDAIAEHTGILHP